MSTNLQLPIHNFNPSVIELFPRINKSYNVESSISKRFNRDYLSNNANFYNGKITDTFLEFVIPGSSNELVDLSSIAAELKIKILKNDGTSIDEQSNVLVCDGFFHRIFQTSSAFLNGVQVEASNHFGLINNIKTYTSLDNYKVASVGSSMFYNNVDKEIKENVGVKLDGDEIHMMGPLLLDIANSDSYLLDSVDMRIRLELAPASLVLISPDDEHYTYSVESCKLWVEKIIPVSSAMVALNKSLINSGFIEFMFDRPILKHDFTKKSIVSNN
jgi:hypothetical protein